MAGLWPVDICTCYRTNVLPDSNAGISLLPHSPLLPFTNGLRSGGKYLQLERSVPEEYILLSNRRLYGDTDEKKLSMCKCGSFTYQIPCQSYHYISTQANLSCISLLPCVALKLGDVPIVAVCTHPDLKSSFYRLLREVLLRQRASFESNHRLITQTIEMWWS